MVNQLFKLVDEEDSLDFQNINLLRRLFFFLSFGCSRYSDWGLCSMDSLLFSPWEELLINRDKLAMLERLRRRISRSLGSEHKEAERSPGLRGLGREYGFCIALVMVDLDDVKDGTSSTEMRSSGPGSPKRGDGIIG